MAEVATEEGTLPLPDGVELYTKTWKPSLPVKTRLVFIHGFSDHCNFYAELFPALAQHGIKVYSFDQRGWGRSARTSAQKGRTGPTSQVMQDMTSFIQNLPADEKDIPLMLMGHSMGGAQVLTYAATGPKDVLSTIRGFLVEAPYIALDPASAPWKITVATGRLAGKVFPNVQMVQKLDASKVCRDPDVCKAWDADPLCHDTGTLQGMAGMLDRGADLDQRKVVVKEGAGEGGKTRFWVGHGTADAVCAFEACRKWFESVQVQDKQMEVYDGWYHKLHSEPGEDKVRFANDVTKWILDRSGPLKSLDLRGGRSQL